jgi:hypothetical protein
MAVLYPVQSVTKSDGAYMYSNRGILLMLYMVSSSKLAIEILLLSREKEKKIAYYLKIPPIHAYEKQSLVRTQGPRSL